MAIAFDKVLIALGRQPNISGFGLEELGVQTNKTVSTNQLLQTNFPNIYACGDVAGPYQFTHVASHQAWYAAVNALFDPFKTFRADYSVIPWVTYTSPQVANVGLTEQQAQKANKEYEVTEYDIGELDRAIADDSAYGRVKVLTKPGKDEILGVNIVGPQAGELLAEYVLAMKQGIGLNKILGTIHSYPTLAEANKYVAGEWKRANAPQKLLAWVRSSIAGAGANMRRLVAATFFLVIFLGTAPIKAEVVNFYAWGGSPQVNSYLRWAQQELKAEGIEFRHNKVADVSEVVKQIISGHSNADIIWINGENFHALKDANALLPIVDDINATQHINPELNWQTDFW